MWIEGTNYPDILVEHDADEKDVTITNSRGVCIMLTDYQYRTLAEALLRLIKTGELPE